VEGVVEAAHTLIGRVLFKVDDDGPTTTLALYEAYRAARADYRKDEPKTSADLPIRAPQDTER
jgi:hypothetical protein